jgi:hypothetical protein
MKIPRLPAMLDALPLIAPCLPFENHSSRLINKQLTDMPTS